MNKKKKREKNCKKLTEQNKNEKINNFPFKIQKPQN